MLVSEKNSFVFLCMPKNASNSIEEMLSPYCELSFLGRPEIRHTTLSEYQNYIKPYLDIKNKNSDKVFETICLIREPVLWLYSWYRFRSRSKLREPSHPLHHNSTANMTFEEFVLAYISEDSPKFVHFGTQYDFVKSVAGGVGVDKIFIYEQMPKFIDYMEKKIGEQLQLPIRNKSPKSVYKSRFLDKLSSSDKLSNLLYFFRKKRIENHSKNMNESLLTECTLKKLKLYLADDFDLYESILKLSN